MTRSLVESIVHHNHKLRWTVFLPKRKAWMQTLILLPFGLPVANFLTNSWLFSVTSMMDGQYLAAILSMGCNVLLPTLFFALLFHWGWFIWRGGTTWYPQVPALRAGSLAMVTIAISFGVVELFNRTLGVCGNPSWGVIGAHLLCNLDGYAFESKSWFGAWFIIAAYCYQLQDQIVARVRSIGQRVKQRHYLEPEVERDFAAHEDLSPNAGIALGIESQD